jgi:hypothetical protein
MNKEFEFDEAFSSFIDGKEYDRTEDILFGLVLSAFKAGWKAAGGGKLPKPELISKYINEKYSFKIPEQLKDQNKKRHADL